MKSDLLLAVTQLAAERSLPQEVVVSAIQDALTMAYERDRLAGGQHVVVDLDPDTGEVTVQTVRNVVEEVEDPEAEWTIEDARKTKPDAQVGDRIPTGIIEQNPGRIAAQTAKQLVMQRLRDAERQLVYDEFVSKEGEVLTATIQRIDSRQITLDLGRAEAIMPPPEQVPTERYRSGMRLKVYIVEVRQSSRGPEIIASRTHSSLLRRLFETEVPEIYNGIIEIRSVAREPGARSKVAVVSNQEGVDPVGACVGLRGIRIQNVVNELMGEKIDVIEWNSDPAEFISNALSPAQVDSVRLNYEEESVVVVVADRSLSLAIGREGQNARLAAKLTNWHIDIKSATEAAQEAPAEPEPEAEVEAAVTAADEAEPVAVEEEPVQEGEPAAEVAATAGLETEEPAAAAQDETAAAEAEPASVEAESATGEEVSPEEELALQALEEEIKRLEEQERAEAEERARLHGEPEEEEEEEGSTESEDVWQVGDWEVPEAATGLRFAEDIVEYRDAGTSRRGRRGRRGGDNMSQKARRAAARRARQSSSDDKR